MSITREQIERLDAELPKGIHVAFGAAKVTDEMIAAAVQYGRNMQERDEKTGADSQAHEPLG